MDQPHTFEHHLRGGITLTLLVFNYVLAVVWAYRILAVTCPTSAPPYYLFAIVVGDDYDRCGNDTELPILLLV